MNKRDVDVVRYLLDDRSAGCSVSSISKGLRLDYKTAHGIVSRLKRDGFVSLEDFGGSWKVSLVRECRPLVFEAECLRRDSALKDKDLSAAVGYFKRGLGQSPYVMLLFGSYAKGTQSKHSDIDLLFIVPDNTEGPYEKSIARIARSIPLDIHVNVFSVRDFIAMKDSKQASVGSEVIKSNIILHGIEDYYGMIG